MGEYSFAQIFEVQICLTCLQLMGTLGKAFSEIRSTRFAMSSANGYVGGNSFQEELLKLSRQQYAAAVT